MDTTNFPAEASRLICARCKHPLVNHALPNGEITRYCNVGATDGKTMSLVTYVKVGCFCSNFKFDLTGECDELAYCL